MIPLIFPNWWSNYWSKQMISYKRYLFSPFLILIFFSFFLIVVLVEYIELIGLQPHLIVLMLLEKDKLWQFSFFTFFLGRATISSKIINTSCLVSLAKWAY